ncbi:TetR/AcrR family transcriptional regulator [Pigmentiphaga soli]|uniref:TetR/AcrR family transcriptional regulator n=1 Tax=Pigmentiphaga soli TaxID=1007095 RepID=A0ABP8HCG1_9BURK
MWTVPTRTPTTPAAKPAKPAAARATYRHGDLRRALLEAAVQLAREGGPGAVVLREATRRAGVVPNAAYRHFASHRDLLKAVRAVALSEVANSMEAELAALGPPRKGIPYARASLRAVGAGYLKFALTQTGLFRTAFAVPFELESPPNPAAAGAGGLNPFELLSAALDRLQRAGALSDAQRPGAEFLAWSAVHGMALLAIDGPLRGLPPPRFEALCQRLLEMVERGL